MVHYWSAVSVRYGCANFGKSGSILYVTVGMTFERIIVLLCQSDFIIVIFIACLFGFII